MSVLNTTTQELRGISIEDKDDVAFTMEEVEDIFITLTEEKLNETSPKLAYKNNQFGKSIFSFVWKYFRRKLDFPQGVRS